MIGANVVNADFSSADLTDANLSEAKIDGTLFEHTSLTGTKLSHAIVNSTNFGSADLKGADLEGARLHDCNLTGANLKLGLANLTPHLRRVFDEHETWIESNGEDGLRGTLIDENLRYIDLAGRDLSAMELRGCELVGADLSRCTMMMTDLANADLRDATLRGAVMLPGSRRHLSLPTLPYAWAAMNLPLSPRRPRTAIGSSKVAERIVQEVETPLDYEGRDLKMGVSIGAAIYPGQWGRGRSARTPC